jgi:dihydroorotase
MSTFSIVGGKVILPGEAEPQAVDIHINGKEIAALGEANGETQIDASNLIVAPGIIDLGVFTTDKPAFRFGGITRAALMPDQSPVHDDPATIQFAGRKGKPDFWVHPIAAATKGLEGTQIAEIAMMKEAGAKAVSSGSNWIADSGLMLKLMQYCAALDLPLILHSEDSGLTAGAVATAGETATRLGLSNAPAIAEALAIARDLMLAEESGAAVHFRQVTTARALDLIRSAKASGLHVTCGITPAHLFLSDDVLADYRTFNRLSPPLRCHDDREACLAAISDGTIDVISSGHNPHGPEAKRLPFSEALAGMAGAETLLAMTLNLVRDGTITFGRLFELLASNPAKILGIDAGEIATGKQADIILINPETPWQIDSGKMAASAGNTPFDKLPVQGKVVKMMKGGEVVS